LKVAGKRSGRVSLAQDLQDCIAVLRLREAEDPLGDDVGMYSCRDMETGSILDVYEVFYITKMQILVTDHGRAKGSCGERDSTHGKAAMPMVQSLR